MERGGRGRRTKEEGAQLRRRRQRVETGREHNCSVRVTLRINASRKEPREEEGRGNACHAYSTVSQDGMGSSVASAYAERLPPKASLFRADHLYRVCQNGLHFSPHGAPKLRRGQWNWEAENAEEERRC